MSKKIILVSLIAGLGLAAVLCLNYRYYSMKSPEVIRRLTGLRLAAGLFRISKGRPPAGLGELIKSGNLEAAPELKLRTHRATSKVRTASGPAVMDTGGWAYINDPKSADYGTFFIDCSHADEKGRYWSWF